MVQAISLFGTTRMIKGTQLHKYLLTDKKYTNASECMKDIYLSCGERYEDMIPFGPDFFVFVF